MTARRALGAAVLVAVAVAAIDACVGRGALVNADGAPLAARFFAAAVHPRLDGTFLLLAWRSTLTTVAYATLGTALAVAIGAVLAPFVSQTWWRGRPVAGPLAWLLARVLLVVPRGIHEVVWGLLLLNVLGLDPLVAVLAIGIPYGAVTAKVFSELLDETDRRPFLALRAGGAGRAAALAYGLVPLALPDLVSYAFYRFECAIRAAAVLGFVGAGGLGFQLALSFTSLRYEEMWTFLWALVLLSGAADLWSTTVRARPRGRGVALASVVGGLALVGFSSWWVHLDPRTLGSDRTGTLFRQLVEQAWPPRGVGGLPQLALDTLAMSVVAAALTALGAFALMYAAAWPSRADRTPPRLVRAALARLVLLLARAIPPPVWALVCLFVLFPGILPGAVALGIYNLGVVGRLAAEAAENAPPEPRRALRAAAATAPQAFLYATLPATFGRFAAYACYRWEVAIRETVVVGVVGAGGIGVLLHRQLASQDYAAVPTTLAVLLVLTLGVDLASAVARRALAR